MKTYQREKIEIKPRLVIQDDTNAENPRTYMDNLGYFITCEKRHNSPDDREDMQSMVQNLADESNSVDEHMKKIKLEFPYNFGEKVIAIYPVVRFEHSYIKYSLGSIKGFDYSNCGFYIVTDKTAKNLGVKKANFLKVIIQELSDYTKWVNGETLRYTLYDEQGNFEDSGAGFYSLPDIKECLPEEWANEDMNEYYINGNAY